MAEDNTQKQIQDEIKLLEAKKNRIQANKIISAQQKDEIKAIDELIKKEKDKLSQIQRNINARKAEAKEFDSFSKNFRKLSEDVQNQLKGTSKNAGVYLSLGSAISKEKGIQAKYAASTKASEKELLEKSQQRESVFSDISSELLSQAKATQQAEDKLRGVSDVQRQIKDIEDSKGLYNAAQKEQMIAALKQTDALRKKEERLVYLKEQQSELVGMLPDGLQKTIGFAKSLGNAIKSGFGPLFLLGAALAAALKSFMDLEEGAKKFREDTGLTNSQMKDIRSQANQITQEFAETGLNAEKVFDTTAALKGQFGDITDFSNEVVASLSLLGQNFGVSAENAAKVQGILESVGGLSSETAASVQMQVAQMANLADVAPSKIFEDIAENAEFASTYFQGNVEALAQAAIQARRLGSNLKSVASTTEHLLDFQSNIGDELVAATFVGGQFSLTQARTLAAAGKTVEAQEEVLRQLNRAGDFREKDYFTQRQLAKAAGMEVSEINRLIGNREKLNSLSAEQRALADKAIEQGLDISNIDKEQLASQVEVFSKQQEQQAVLEKISNQFMGIASTVGGVLVPILDAVALIINVILAPIQLINDLFGSIGTGISNLIGPLGAVGKLLKGLAGLAIIYAAYKAYASLATIPIVGVGLGIAAAAAVTAAGFGLLSKVGDLAIDPNGGPIIASPREGGIFQGTKNDGVSMGPGFGLNPNIQNNTEALSTTNNNVTVDMGGVINELKSLKQEFTKRRDTYLDGKRVTANIATNVDKSTKNNFSFAT